MMRTTLASLVIAALLFAGCKKDNSQKAKTYQLNSITYTANGVNTTAIYAYDSEGRLSAYNDTRLGNTYKYTYGADGKVSSADVLGASSFLLETDKFTYTGNTVNVQGTGGDVQIQNFNYTFNDKKQLIKADSYDNTYVAFTYNDAGDITNITQHNTDGSVLSTASYTYDDKPNPFHAMAANNLHFAIFSDAAASLSVHNIVTSSNSIATNNYKYLDNGLPYSITAVSADGGASTYVTYNYSSK
jgi:YD repeat-containing protein